MPGLRLPEVAHERFPNPPLKSMLGQVRYAPVLQIVDPGFIAPLQERIRSLYPDLQREDEVGVMISPEGTFKTDTSRRWRLSGSEGWSVILATEFVSLQSDAADYTSYEDFARRFGEVWDVLLETIRPTQITQQGLRYINHFERTGPPAEWRRLINPDLLGPIGGNVFGDELQQAICDFRLARPDGQLVLKHGLVRAGPNQTPGYLLDFDYFTQEIGTGLSREILLEKFNAFHEVMYRLFRWSLTPEGTDELRGGGQDAETGASGGGPRG